MDFTKIYGMFALPGDAPMIFHYILIIFQIAVVIGVTMLHVAYCTWFERKVIGHMQVRVGPMLTGYHGLLQPFADFIKLFFKEDIIPSAGDKVVFRLAPMISLFATISALAVIPFFDAFYIANINIGLLYLFAMSSLSAYGIIMAGWASNSKYAFLGSLRSAAQVISYEVAMGLSLVGIMLMAGSLNLSEIVAAQERTWYGMFIFPQFLAFFVFIICALAETNRAPFDLPEAESELVAGYFVEYSGMRFALFFLAEYVAMIVMSCVSVICFFGGWTVPRAVLHVLPFLDVVPGIVWFLLKVYCHLFMYYWIRATLPRFRYDHLMNLGWKVLIPLALFNIVVTSIIKFFA
jgi:NADH-quinone oxidoreductase subunit H